MPRRIGLCSTTQTFAEPARAECVFPLAREAAGRGALEQLELIDAFLAAYPRTEPWQRVVHVERSPACLALVIERFVGVSWHELIGDLRKLQRKLPLNVWAALVDQFLEAVEPVPLRREWSPAPGAIGLSLDGSITLAPSSLNSILEEVVTLPGTLVSKYFYLSPEEIRGAAPVPQSSVFVWAAISWHLLTGLPPFRADSELAIFEAARQGKAGLLEHPERTLALDQFFDRCFAPRPEARWADVAAMRLGLQAAVGAVVPRERAFGLVLTVAAPRVRALLGELREEPGLLPPQWRGVYPAGVKPTEGLMVFEDRLLELQQPATQLVGSADVPQPSRPPSLRINLAPPPRPGLLQRALGWLSRGETRRS